MSREFATPEASLRIYNSLSSWLYENGSVEADSREIVGHYLGLPIIEGGCGIDYNFSLDTAVLKEQAPEFATAFEIGGKAVSAYFMPAFYYPPDDEEAYPSDLEYAKVGFYIQKNRESKLESESLEIQDRTSAGGMHVYRNIERRISRNGCEVIHEETEAGQGQPNSLNTQEYRGLESLAYLLYFNDPESFRFEPAWQDEIPRDMLLE